MVLMVLMVLMDLMDLMVLMVLMAQRGCSRDLLEASRPGVGTSSSRGAT